MSRAGRWVLSLLLWFWGGTVYFLLEVAYKTIRGEPQRISWTMLVLAVLLTIPVERCGEQLPWHVPLWLQALSCAALVTAVELAAGLILNVWLGLGAMTAGMVLMAWGQLIYMPARFSCGPRAALTVGVGKRLRRLPIGAVEIMIQSAACFAGWLLGGSVGIGTLWFALGNGFVMQSVFHLARFEPRSLTHQGIHQLVSWKQEES